MPAKGGNLCLFMMFCFSNFFLIALGAGLIFLGIYEMITMGVFNLIDGGTSVAGLITALLGIMSFCGRKSLCIITFDLFLLIVTFCGYVALTVCYWNDMVCTYSDETKKACEDIEQVAGDILKYALLGTDGMILLIIILGLIYRGSMTSRRMEGEIRLFSYFLMNRHVTLREGKEFQQAKEHIEKARQSVNDRKKAYAEKYDSMAKYAPMS